MSCKRCENFQEGNTGDFYYFRWKTANIQLAGCKKHVEEVMEVLREAQKEGEQSPSTGA